jgi:hypothetical protein
MEVADELPVSATGAFIVTNARIAITQLNL